MKKNAIILTTIMIINKIFGIVRELLLTKYFGATNVTDAYIIASSIPNALFVFVATGITTSYIPIFNKIKTHESPEDSEKFTSNLINILIVVFAVVILFGLIFTTPLVRIFAAHFDAETMAIAVRFTKITLFAIEFQAILAIFQGYLQIKDRFVAHGLSFIVMNVTVVSSILAAKSSDPILLAYGITASIAFQSLFIYLISRRNGYRHSWHIKIKDDYIKMMAIMAIPVVIGSSIDQINGIFDKTMASGVMIGGISMINYAVKISDSIIGLFVTSIITVLFPMLSKYAAENRTDDLKDSIAKTLVAMNLIVIPATIGIIVLAQPVVQLFYGRGKFTPEQVVITAKVLQTASIGLILNANAMILLRVFYSMGETKRPVILGAIAVLANIIFSLIFVRFLYLPGLTLGTSMSKIVYFTLIYYFLYKKIGDFHNRYIFITVGKLLIASLIMGGAVHFVFPLITNRFDLLFSVALAALVGVVVYFILVKLFKVPEFDRALDEVKSKIKSMLKRA